MANKQVIFSDRIVGMSIQNGLVRIDLATIAGRVKNKDGQEGFKMDVTHQLVIPMDGFVAGMGMQQKLLKEVASRSQKRRQGAATAEAAAEPSAAEAGKA